MGKCPESELEVPGAAEGGKSAWLCGKVGREWLEPGEEGVARYVGLHKLAWGSPFIQMGAYQKQVEASLWHTKCIMCYPFTAELQGAQRASQTMGGARLLRASEAQLSFQSIR